MAISPIVELCNTILQNLNYRYKKFIEADLFRRYTWVSIQINYVIDTIETNPEEVINKWKNYLLPESRDISLASCSEGWIPWTSLNI
jgi:hypothetical protein